MNNNINSKDKIGYLVFIYFIVFVLFKMPFNISVLCASSNEGFYFVYGQYFLNEHRLMDHFSGPLFILIFALVLKIFGFGTGSIIAIHLVHTLVVLLIGILIFLLCRVLLNNTLLSAIATCLWLILLLTPIGGWGALLEYESALSFEAEYLCVLFSLSAIYLLILGNGSKKQILFSFIAGFLSVCSIMSKANGAILPIALICWIVYILIFEKEQIGNFKSTIFYFFVGVVFSLLVFNLFLYFHVDNLLSNWKEHFSVGSYSRDYLYSLNNFFKFIYKFMTRDTSSLNNFILFLLLFLSLIWGLIRNKFLKHNKNIFVPLLSLWGIGNICTVIAPGEYGSYYYILIWPVMAIFFSVLIYDLYWSLNLKYVAVVFALLFLSLFGYRVFSMMPLYRDLVSEQMPYDFINQPESFQDISAYDFFSQPHNKHRSFLLRMADRINSLLPERQDKFYIFNFSHQHQDFSPTIYIYAKRLPSSAILSDFMFYEKHLNKLQILKNDFVVNPPKLILVPKKVKMDPRQEKELRPFFKWVTAFLSNNYHFSEQFSYCHTGLSPEEIDVYEINK